MDLRSRLLALIAPTGIGDVLDDGARLVDVSTELGLVLTFEHRGSEIAVEVDAAAERRPHAARSRHFTFGYRVGDRSAPISSEAGRALCALVAARAARNERALVAALRVVDSAPHDGPKVREVRADRLLERAGTPDARYFTLTPHVGCLIGCRFCYAQSRVDKPRRLAGEPALPWGSWVDVRVDAPEVLARELAASPAWPIKLCPIASDPYHAIERRYRVTRRCLEVLRDAPPRDVLVLTRSASIVEDAALLASIPRAYAGVSLPTVDDDVRRRFEPRAASVADRLAALEALRAAGVRTFAIVQPIFPGSIEDLARALAERVSSVRIDVLRGTYGASADVAAFPEVADPEWQAARAEELAAALVARGVALWPGELPPRGA